MTTSERAGVGLLVLRLAVGTVFVLHGWMNIVGGQASFLREMLAIVGWSAPSAVVWAITLFELCGGLALVLGIFSRIAALGLMLEMIMAVVLFHVRQGSFIIAVPNVPLAYSFEYHLTLIGALACLALEGPGIRALQHRGDRRRGGATPTPAATD